MFNFLTNQLQLPVDNDSYAQPLRLVYRYCPKTQSEEVVDGNMTLTFATQNADFRQLNVTTGGNNSYFILPDYDSQTFYQCQLQGYFAFTPEWYNQEPEA